MRANAYAKSVTAVERGMLAINTDPTQGLDSLRSALAALHEFAPMLAEDPAALELRTLAEFALARAMLANGDHEGAVASLDATLARLAGAPLPEVPLGPRFGALVSERLRALAARGQAHLRIACEAPCQVYIDERVIAAALGDEAIVTLPLGEHHLWIEPGEREREPMRLSVTMTARDATLTVLFSSPERRSWRALVPAEASLASAASQG